MKNSTLAKLVLSTTLLVGINASVVTTVFAASTNNTTSASQTASVGAASGANTTDNTVAGNSTGAGIGTGNNSTSTANASAPGLIPGDFFYFVKTVIEKIQLALTFNDTAKAQLLAQFAHERIAEANALIKAGKPELASQTLKAALQDQLLSVNYIDKSSSSGGDANNTTSGNSVDSTGLNTAGSVNGVNSTTNGNVSFNTTSNVTIGTGTLGGQVPSQVTVHLAQNMVALSEALQHVKNPHAQQALEKNIAKAFAHLEKRLQKLGVQSGENMTSNFSSDEYQGDDGHEFMGNVSNSTTSTSGSVYSTNATGPSNTVSSMPPEREHDASENEQSPSNKGAFGVNFGNSVQVPFIGHQQTHQRGNQGQERQDHGHGEHHGHGDH